MRRPLLSVGRRLRLRHAGRAAARLPAPRGVLDAGCGDGRMAAVLARRYPAAEVLGIDSDEAALTGGERLAQGLPNLELRRGEVGGAPLGREFDLVLCTDVLEHLPEPGVAVRWLAEHLTPNGFLVLHVPATPQRHWLRTVAAAMQAELAGGRGPHLREGFSPDEVRELAAGAELTEVSLGFSFHHPLAWRAADLETWTYLRGARWLKALLLPLLLGACTLERRPSRSRAGNGLLLVAGRAAP